MFRETLWFKRGELIEPATDDVPVELPIEDRYLDHGSTTYTDSVTFGLHTGQTLQMPRIGHAAATIACAPTPDLQSLIRELQQRHRRLYAILGAAMFITFVVMTGIL